MPISRAAVWQVVEQPEGHGPVEWGVTAHTPDEALAAARYLVRGTCEPSEFHGPMRLEIHADSPLDERIGPEDIIGGDDSTLVAVATFAEYADLL